MSTKHRRSAGSSASRFNDTSRAWTTNTRAHALAQSMSQPRRSPRTRGLDEQMGVNALMSSSSTSVGSAQTRTPSILSRPICRAAVALVAGYVLLGGCARGDASTSEALSTLRAAGITDKPVCFLAAVDFPYAPSGLFAQLSPDTMVAERLSRLGLLTMYRDAAGGSVRFDLTAAGKSAWSPGAQGAPERGFCTGTVRILEAQAEPVVESGGVRTQVISFAPRPVPDKAAKWATSVEAQQLFPELAVFTRAAELPARVQVQLRHLPQTGWRVASGPQPVAASPRQASR